MQTTATALPIKALQAIGLRASAATIYLVLTDIMQKSMTAHELVVEIGLSRSGANKALKELLVKGFIEERRIIKATRYNAIMLGQARENYALYQRQAVKDLLQAQHEREVLHNPPLSVTIDTR